MVGIYKITNTITGQCYIGQSVNIEERWKIHIRNGEHLYEKNKISLALNQYGIDAFKFEVLEECPVEQEILNERERYWINYYDSFNNGYNSTLGGQSIGNQKYDLQVIRDLWDEGYSIGEIVEIIGCCSNTVEKYLKGYSDYNPHISRSRGRQFLIEKGTQFLCMPIMVYQYDLNGQYIAEYKSMKEAARALGHDQPNNISEAINHKQKTAYGYQWSKEKVESMPMVSTLSGKLVRCINTGQIFHSSYEAAVWCNSKNRSGIQGCCVGRCKTAGKHPETGEPLKWEYVE